MRSNKRNDLKSCYIVSAWQILYGTEGSGGKSNEITAIAKILRAIKIKGQILTIDTMGTQTAVAETIRKKTGGLCISSKGKSGDSDTPVF